MRRALLLIILLPLFCKAQSVENLDIKNGFLQFRLGDSLANYKLMIDPIKNQPGYYEVKSKFNKLKRYTSHITLFFENGKLQNIQFTPSTGYGDLDYIEAAIKKCYGDGLEIKNGTENDPGVHVVYQMWVGKKVSAVLEKHISHLVVGGKNFDIVFDFFKIKKISDVEVVGKLNQDFIL